MNRISDALYEKADDLFSEGASLREVVCAVGIAKETASRIQRRGRLADIAFRGRTRVNTGKRKDGTISFYYTAEHRESWDRQHYGGIEDFR